MAVNQLKQQISQNGINLEGTSDVIGNSIESGEYVIKAKLPTEMPLIEPLHKIFEIEDDPIMTMYNKEIEKQFLVA